MGLGSTADDELSPEDQEIILMDRWIYIYYFVFIFTVSLYPIDVRTAEPIRPKEMVSNLGLAEID